MARVSYVSPFYSFFHSQLKYTTLHSIEKSKWIVEGTSPVCENEECLLP